MGQRTAEDISASPNFLCFMSVLLEQSGMQSPSTLVGLLLVVQSGAMNASNLTIIFAFRSQ